MQLSPSALAQVTAIISGTNLPNYAAAYAVVLGDLTNSNPNATGADADTLRWLTVAEQVNSDAYTLVAIAIRACNAAASELLNGTQISLFGLEEQDSSNAVAAKFFESIYAKIGGYNVNQVCLKLFVRC